MKIKLRKIFWLFLLTIIIGCIVTGNWIPMLIMCGGILILSAVVGIIIGMANVNSKEEITIYIVEGKSKEPYISDGRFKQESEFEQDETLH